MPVADSSQPVSGVAQRYASSLFDLALEAGAIDAVSRDLDGLAAALDESADLRRLISSPEFSTEDKLRAISAISGKAGHGALSSNFLKVIAANGRLSALPEMIRAFRLAVADHRGEVAAEVTVAHALDAAQQNELKTALKGVTGKDVAVSLTVDPSILGGLVVRIGSRQIDTSLRTKLSTLKLALKEVG